MTLIERKLEKKKKKMTSALFFSFALQAFFFGVADYTIHTNNRLGKCMGAAGIIRCREIFCTIFSSLNEKYDPIAGENYFFLHLSCFSLRRHPLLSHEIKF